MVIPFGSGTEHISESFGNIADITTREFDRIVLAIERTDHRLEQMPEILFLDLVYSLTGGLHPKISVSLPKDSDNPFNLELGQHNQLVTPTLLVYSGIVTGEYRKIA